MSEGAQEFDDVIYIYARDLQFDFGSYDVHRSLENSWFIPEPDGMRLNLEGPWLD